MYYILYMLVATTVSWGTAHFNILKELFQISELRENKSTSFGHDITLSRNVGKKCPWHGVTSQNNLCLTLWLFDIFSIFQEYQTRI